MRKLSKGLYKCPGSSLNLRVLNVRYQCEIYVKAKLQFEYKNGMICEIKNYKLYLDKIQHWEKI